MGISIEANRMRTEKAFTDKTFIVLVEFSTPLVGNVVCFLGLMKWFASFVGDFNNRY